MKGKTILSRQYLKIRNLKTGTIAKIKASNVILTLICLIWSCLRIIHRPSRINYPLSKSSTHSGWLSFSPLVLPCIIPDYRKILFYLKNNCYKVFKLCSLIIILLICLMLFKYFKIKELEVQGGRIITKNITASASFSSIKQSQFSRSIIQNNRIISQL